MAKQFSVVLVARFQLGISISIFLVINQFVLVLVLVIAITFICFSYNNY